MVIPLHAGRDPSLTGQALDRLLELAAVTSEFVEDGLAARGLTPARAGVLWQLYRYGEMTQRELAGATGVTPARITGLLDGLESGGFALRGPHPTDRRATLVSLTERGRTTVRELGAEFRYNADRLFAGVTEGELLAFLTVSTRLINRIRRPSCH